MNLTQQNELTLDDQQKLWRAKNRGAVRKIAGDCEVSRSFVDKVFRGEMKSGERRVERELARRGCPGFEQHIPQAPDLNE